MTRPHRWTSVHLHATRETLDRYLAAGFRDAWAQVASSPLVRRQFHLRYAEGGLHVRWRVQGVAGTPPAVVQRLVCRAVRRTRAGLPLAIRLVAYDRRRHYFGDTRASVYAELLNVATSAYALPLLGARRSRRRTTALAAAALTAVARASHAAPRDAARFVDAVDAVLRPAAARPHDAGAVAPAVATAVGALAARLPPVPPALARLLVRAAREAARDAVAPHAGHLLLNKLGARPHDEAVACALARAILLAETVA